MKRTPKKHNKKKLELNRRNIRKLDRGALDQAAGGIFPTLVCTNIDAANQL